MEHIDPVKSVRNQLTIVGRFKAGITANCSTVWNFTVGYTQGFGI
jgi:hypothetical protein